MITSTSNPFIKQIRKLRDRKEREQSNLFYIEGLRIIGEAVELEVELDTFIVAPDLVKGEFSTHLVENQLSKGTSIIEVSPQVYEYISMREGAKGLSALVRQQWDRLDNINLQPGDLWVALDGVQDPGNLGTILRTLDCAGGKGVILLDHSTDPYDPTAVRASMGSIFSQRVIKSSLDEFTRWKNFVGFPVIGTSGIADEDYHSFHFPPALVLLMGSERQGLQNEHLNICDQVVSIPMAGRSDSLNLAVSTAIVIYEIINQRRDALMSRP